MAKLIISLLVGVTCLSVYASQTDAMEPLERMRFLSEYTYQNTTETKGTNGFGDPYLFWDKTNKKYYLTGTGPGFCFVITSSPDLIHWTPPRFILRSNQIKWCKPGTYNLWGAEIYKRGDTYYLYYSAFSKKGSMAIGAATSQKVDGVYTPLDKPVLDFGKSTIDNNLFVDTNGKKYMVFVRDMSENLTDPKTDRHESQVYVTEMNNDWISVKAKNFDEAKLLLKPSQQWELSGGNWLWNEGSWMQKFGNTYYLFYSANYFGDFADGSFSQYSIGYATSRSIKGPFVKYRGNPLIQTNGRTMRGPGNNSLCYSPDKKELLTAYHMMNKGRYVAIDRLGLRRDGSVFLSGQNLGIQPIPSGTKPNHTLLSDQAKVKVSSHRNGSSPKALNDGEIVVMPRYAKNCWCSLENPEKVEEQYAALYFRWGVEIHSIFVWGTVEEGTRPESVNLSFSDGTVIRHQPFPKERDQPLILPLKGKKSSFVKISVDRKAPDQKSFALSEIKVYGK